MKGREIKWFDHGAFFQSDHGVRIDSEDFHLIAGRHVSIDTYAYVILDKKRIRLHNWFCPSESGFFTDHINRDKLDNRRSNLRSVTISNSNINKTNNVPKTSRFRGVSRFRISSHGGKYQYWYWRATICKNYKQTTIGCFKTQEEAAEAYNKAALEIHGKEFACLNRIAA